MISKAREELRNAARATRKADGHMALRNWLLHLAEEKKEALLANRGQAADEMRGFVKILRTALKDIDAEETPRQRSNPYA